MDYFALAEFITTAMLALSVLVLTLGFTIRVFLAPVLRDLFGARRTDDTSATLLAGQIVRLEDRLDSIDHALGNLQDARSFERALEDVADDSGVAGLRR